MCVFCICARDGDVVHVNSTEVLGCFCLGFWGQCSVLWVKYPIGLEGGSFYGECAVYSGGVYFKFFLEED